MAYRIDILDRTMLFDLLKQLRTDQEPCFGAMSARHMVEHLGFAVDFSNGRAPQPLYLPAEKAEKIKAAMIDTGMAFPVGFKAPMLPAAGLPPLRYPDLATAVEKLKHSLTGFDSYFVQEPNARPMNPILGALTKTEWIIFHDKHFTHHFKQFALIE